MSPHRDYTPPPATAGDLQRMLQAVGLSRAVIVTPTIYDDNRAALDAIRQLGQRRARGIALIDEGTSFAILNDMAQLAEWVPDVATRHKILVDNPARLYRF